MNHGVRLIRGNQPFNLNQQLSSAEISLKKQELIRGERGVQQDVADSLHVSRVSNVDLIAGMAAWPSEVLLRHAFRMTKQRHQVLEGFSGLLLREVEMLARVSQNAGSSGNQQVSLGINPTQAGAGK